MAGDNNSRKAPTSDQTSTPSNPKTKKSKTANTSVTSSRAGTPSINGDSVSKPKGTAASRADDSETKQCKHCKKYVLKDGFNGHSKQCLRDKKEKKRQKEAQAAAAQAEKDRAENGETVVKDAEGDVAIDDETILVKPPSIAPDASGNNADNDETGASTPTSVVAAKPLKKSSTLVSEPDGPSTSATKKTTTNKKRKADEAASTPAEKPPNKKQKKKDEAAAKPKPAPKPKGPVDVEKQCGVVMPNGQMCARSLTCKSHSMGAKRSVPGRSARYDVLLAQYQKKNQARMQKAAIANLAPQVDEFDEANAGALDSDEEKDAVMTAIARSNPRPLVENPVISVRQRYQKVRIKEMLSQALGGSGRGATSLFRVGPPMRPGDVSAIQETEASRRGSFVAPQHIRSGSVSAAV